MNGTVFIWTEFHGVPPMLRFRRFRRVLSDWFRSGRNCVNRAVELVALLNCPSCADVIVLPPKSATYAIISGSKEMCHGSRAGTSHLPRRFRSSASTGKNRSAVLGLFAGG